MNAGIWMDRKKARAHNIREHMIFTIYIYIYIYLEECVIYIYI